MGGVERVTLRLLQELQAQQPGLRLHVAVLNNSGELATDFNSSLDVTTLPAGELARGRALRKLVRDTAVKVVMFSKGGLSRYQLFLPAGVRSCVVQHVPIALPGVSTVKNKMRKVIAALCYRLVDRVVTVSDGLNQDVRFSLKLAPRHVSTIYNPVLTEAVFRQSQQPLPAEVTKLGNYYLCVGRLDYQKGYDLLLQIWQQLPAPRPQLVIVGDGPLKAQLQEQISAKQLSAQVHLLGADTNPFRYMRHAQALLLPSRFEGLPTVLVEAAALGCPLVAFNCPHGPYELLHGGQHGYLIENHDLAGFAAAVVKLEAGQQRPLPDVSAFHVSVAADNYYRLFTQLCDGP